MKEPHSISLYPGTGTADGQRGDHILIAPAYNVSEADVRRIVDTTTAVVKQFFRERYGDRYSIVDLQLGIMNAGVKSWSVDASG